MLDIEERYKTVRDLLRGKGEGDMSATTRVWWCELVDLSDSWHELNERGDLESENERGDDESENEMVEMVEMVEMAEQERGVSALEPQIADLSIS